MNEQKQTLVIVDGHAIIHRAYHALPMMTIQDGTLVNAVYGFASMLLKIFETIRPTHIVVTFDVSKDTFRKEIYTAYKAHREAADDDLYDQIPRIKDMLRAANIDIYEKEGYEADDVIGTIATEMKDQVDKIIIVTGDKDMLQLVDNTSIEVYLLKKGLSEFVLYNEDKVIADFGFDPMQMIDFKALCGDVSDNIPGIKGVGIKTARQIIQAFGTIDAMYAVLVDDRSILDGVVPKRMVEKIVSGEEDARLSYRLATIETAVKEIDFCLDDAVLTKIDTAGLRDQFVQYEFFSLVQRLDGKQAPVSPMVPASTEEDSFSIVGTDISFEEARRAVQQEARLYLKESFSSEDVFTATLDALAIGTETTVYVFPKQYATEVCTDIGKHHTLVGHDIKPFIKYCIHHNIDCQAMLFDTMIASYLTNTNTRSHDLRSVIARAVGVVLPEEPKQGNLFGVSPQEIAKTVTYLQSLYHTLTAALDTSHVRQVFTDIEMPLISILAEMELYGVAVDSNLLDQLSQRTAKEIRAISETIWALTDKEFNISSSMQLRDILFETLELPTEGIKKGKTGYSTASSELEKLRAYHPIIPLIEEYRELEKLRNTYIDVLPVLVHPVTGRIHTSFNQAVTATGRLSSSDPNLQNIPIRTELGKEVRNAFIAAPGYKLVTADYSQMELRIIAHLAKDETLLRAFREGKDIHTATAAVIHGIPEAEVTKEIRRTAKEVNFGVLYGMGAFGLADRTGISRAEAKQFIDTYFERFSSIKTYFDSILQFAETHGYVETLYGRRRYIPELTSKNFQIKATGERMAMNMPIQGTLADIMKLAMVAVSDRITADGVQQTADVKMLLQVHDELVLEVREEHATEIASILKTVMSGVATLDVPIVVEAHVGDRWGEMK